MSARRDDEQGAALILAIAFMVVVGMLTAVTLSLITGGLQNRVKLDENRDRQYAADAAIENAIAQVRELDAPGPGLADCEPAVAGTYELNGHEIRVSCTNAVTVTFSGYLQRNVIFNACDASEMICDDEDSIIRAQVNFATIAQGDDDVDVTRTTVQYWSVN